MSLPTAAMTTTTATATTTVSQPNKSIGRFGDSLVRQIVGHLSTEDQFRCECLSRQFQRCVYHNVVDIDANVINRLKVVAVTAAANQSTAAAAAKNNGQHLNGDGAAGGLFSKNNNTAAATVVSTLPKADPQPELLMVIDVVSGGGDHTAAGGQSTGVNYHQLNGTDGGGDGDGISGQHRMVDDQHNDEADIQIVPISSEPIESVTKTIDTATAANNNNNNNSNINIANHCYYDKDEEELAAAAKMAIDSDAEVIDDLVADESLTVTTTTTTIGTTSATASLMDCMDDNESSTADLSAVLLPEASEWTMKDDSHASTDCLMVTDSDTKSAINFGEQSSSSSSSNNNSQTSTANLVVPPNDVKSDQLLLVDIYEDNGSGGDNSLQLAPDNIVANNPPAGCVKKVADGRQSRIDFHKETSTAAIGQQQREVTANDTVDACKISVTEAAAVAKTSSGQSIKQQTNNWSLIQRPTKDLILEPLPIMHLDRLATLLRKCRAIRVIDLKRLKDFANIDSIVDTIVANCARIERIILSINDRHYPAVANFESYRKLFEHFGPDIHAITIYGCFPFSLKKADRDRPLSVLKLCPNVRWFDGNSALNLCHIYADSQCFFDQLERLAINYKNGDIHILKKYLKTNSASLKYLKLTTNGSLTRVLCGQISGLANLRHLLIDSYAQHTPEMGLPDILRSVATECKQLIELNLHLSLKSKLMARQVLESMKYYKSLKRLSLSLYYSTLFISNAGSVGDLTADDSDLHFKCKPLTACRQLTHLKLMDIDVNDIFFYNIDKHLPKLRDLLIYSYRAKDLMTDQTVKQLAKLPQLESICISGCQAKITDRAVEEWIGKCPRLKTILLGGKRFTGQSSSNTSTGSASYSAK